MMATRKIVSFLTVLMMITSGITLTAFAAAPLPEADTEGATSVLEDAVFAPASEVTLREDGVAEQIGSKESPFEPELVPAGTSLDGLTPAPDTLTELIKHEFVSKGNLPEDLGQGFDGGDFYRGVSDSRATNKILLVDDDDSTAVNSTQFWNNSGLYNTDTGKIWSDTLTAAGYAHDTHVVPAGRNGPDYATISQYSVIIWAFGYEYGYLPTLTNNDYHRLVNFMEAGGNVWFSGPLWMYDMYGNQNITDFTDTGFAKKYLGIEEYYPLVGQPNPVNATATGGIMTGSEQYATRNWFNDEGDIRYLLGSILRPVTSGKEILIGDIVDFFGNSFDDEPFVIGYDSGTWKSVSGTVDPAIIASDTDRKDFVNKVMTWLTTPMPTIDTSRVNIMNMNVSVDDQSPRYTDLFDYAYWAVPRQTTTGQIVRFFPPIVATVHTHEDFTFTSNFENQGPAQNNFDVRIMVSDSMGNMLKNFTKKTSVGARTIGSVSDSFTPTRAGFYLVRTNITIAADVYRFDNTLSFAYWVRAAEWLDDLENGTTGWSKEGSWKESNDADHYQTADTGFLWQKTGTTDADGDSLQPPEVDLRFYNLSFDHWYFTTMEMIWFNFYFHGRLYGTGQDYFEILYKASNMTTWNSFYKIDGTDPGENDVPGDFDDNWWFFGRGLYLGAYQGQTVQLKFVMVKRNPAPPHSWVAIDDFIVWMGHERNEAPWFLGKYMKTDGVEEELDHDLEHIYMDVGTDFDMRVFVEDQTMDEPITYQWVENSVYIPGATTNMTSFSIPQTVAIGHKYERGGQLEVACYVRDDIAANGTLWYIHLLDPRPVLRGTEPLELEINEDEVTPIDFGTSTNPTWFEDIEDQTFTVTSTGSTHIQVSPGTNNVLNLVNKVSNWNGYDNVTITVTDEAGSISEFVFEVHVLPINDAPQWRVEKPLKKAQEGSYYSVNITFGVAGEFIWVEDVDNVFADMEWTTNATFFTFGATPEIAFNPTNDDVGKHFFSVTASDGELADTLNLTLTVDNVNQEPKLLPLPDMVAIEDVPFTFDLSDYVDDIDLLIPERWRTDFIEYRENDRDMETNIQTGVVTWTPTNDDVGERFVTFSVTDSESKTDQQQIKVEVRNTNDEPTINAVPKQRLSQGTRHVLTIVVEDDDLEEWVKDAGYSESHTWSNDHTELFEIGPTDGSIDFTPENEDVGTWEITITVTDSEGAKSSRVVIFEILNVNDAPKFQKVATEQDVVEDVPFTLMINASDPDMEARKLDGEQVDPLESISFRTNNTDVTITDEGRLSFNPTNAHALRNRVTVRIFVYDNEGDEDNWDIVFKVQQVNDLPENLNIIGLVDLQKIKEGSKVTLRGTATDQENTETQLTYKWYAGTTLIGSFQVFEWEVSGKGATQIILEVTDQDGGKATKSLNVTIEQKEDEPGFEMAFAVLAISIIAVMAVAVRRRRHL